MDRREFLKKSMLLSAGALVGGNLFSNTATFDGDKGAAPRKKKTIGLQLYSIGGDMGQDAAGSLKKISDMGYSAAETANYNGDGKFYGRTPAEFRKMAEDVGIKVTGAHLGHGYDKNNEQGCLDWWKKACDAQAAVGGKYIVMPGFSVDNLPALQEYCEYFNKIGEIANKVGLKFGYHNHAHEFAKLEGHVIEDYMIENTDPDKVMYELDVFWASKGGVNPSAYITKYAGRFPLLHIKDEDVIGASETIDFKSIFDAAYKQGLQAYYVEIESNALPPMVCAEKSAYYLDSSKFVK